MRGSWFVGGLAAFAAAGCSEWPRSGNLGAEPEYAAAGEVVTVPAVYNGTDEESTYVTPDTAVADGDWPDFAVEMDQKLTVQAHGIAQMFHGTLDSSGWTDEFVEDPANCQSGPIAPGYYDGDADALRVFDLELASYLCVRGRIDTTADVGWDLAVYKIEGVCATPVTDGAGVTLGSNLSRPDVVWGANLEPGTYAAVIGAYYPSSADLDLTYSVGLSAWAPFTGSAEQCPLLEDAQ